MTIVVGILLTLLQAALAYSFWKLGFQSGAQKVYKKFKDEFPTMQEFHGREGVVFRACFSENPADMQYEKFCNVLSAMATEYHSAENVVRREFPHIKFTEGKEKSNGQEKTAAA